MDYHAIKIPCPKCQKDGTILNFCIRADGWVALDCVCVLCGSDFNWEASTARLIIAADKCDEQLPRQFNFVDMPCEGRPS